MIRRLPAFSLLLILSLLCLSSCSRNERKSGDDAGGKTDKETAESAAAESGNAPAASSSEEQEPEERCVEAILSGEPASMDLAALYLSSGNVMCRTEKDLPFRLPKNAVTLNVFLYPVHDAQFRCRITDSSAVLLEERILPPEQLPVLLERAVEKAGYSASAEIAFKGENKQNAAWLHELKMRLIRSSRIRIRPRTPAPSVISVDGNGQVFGVVIERYLLGIVHHVAALDVNSMKRAAERICLDLKSVPDPDEYRPAEEARALLDDLYRLSRTMKTYRRKDYEKIADLTSLMTALVPDDPRFRFEQLWFSLLPLLDPALSPDQKKALTDTFLKEADSFLRQYPDFLFPALPSGDDRPFAGHPFCPLDPIRDAPEAAPICAWLLTLRQGNGTESERIPEPGPHATRAELLGWCEVIRRRSVDGLPGGDSASLARLRFRNQLSMLRRLRSYAGSHPDEASSIMPKTFFFPCEDRAPESGRDEFWKMVRFLILTEGKDLIREAAALKTPAALRYAAELQALFDWSRSRGTGAELRTILAAKMDALFKTGFRLRPGMTCGGYLTDMISVLSPCSASGEKLTLILQAYPFEHIFRKEKGIDANQTMLCLVEAGVRDPGFLIRNAEKIRSLAFRTLTDPTANNSYSILAASLFRRDPGDPQIRQAVASLNDKFEIRRIPSSGGRCVASCLYGNTLYMLCRNEQDILSVTAADLISGTSSDLAMPPVLFRNFQSAVRLSGGSEACTISAADGWLTVCGENTILLYDLDHEIWKKCTGLFGRFPVCARVRGDRLFYLCGGVPGPDGSDKVLSLHSCRLDGSDALVYFHGDRPLQHPFDTLRKGRVSGFFPVQGGWLFTASSRNHFAKICLFDPVKGVLSYVEELSPAFRIFALTENAGSFLGQGGDSFFLCPDRDPRRKSWLFSQSLADRTQTPLRIPGCGAFQMPAALLSGRYLVSARSGASPSLIDLKDWEKSPLLFLPECAGVYCGPEPRTLIFPAVFDGTVFILRMKQP